MWRYVIITHIEWNISMSAIDQPNCESSVPCHYTMYCTLGKKCAADVVWCIAWNCPDHVSWIWHITKFRNLNMIVWDRNRSKGKRIQLVELTYIFKIDGHRIFPCKVILFQQDECLFKGRELHKLTVLARYFYF